MTGATAVFSTDATADVFAAAFFSAGLAAGFAAALADADLRFGDLADVLAGGAVFVDDFFVASAFAALALTERFRGDFFAPFAGFFLAVVIFTFP